ncbi:MAG TPA: Flp pilus assembly protein CpaB [Solirubrobacteraceae bacterium]|nr:Flp pilus assembly protein CpaB [Solirubrobacteraceae bacterium]
MNPRQRQGRLVFALGVLVCIVAFVVIARYVADVREEVDPKVRVVALGRDVRANEPLDAAALRLVEIPERWVPRTALRDRSALAGLVAAADYPEGSIVQQGMAEGPPELSPGQREIAILVDAETGVAGKVDPGSNVDIVATFAAEEGRPARSRVLVPGARVLDIGEAREQREGEDGAVDPSAVVPVTFALNVRQSLALTYAESFAEEVRLALVRPGEQSDIPLDEREYRP